MAAFDGLLTSASRGTKSRVPFEFARARGRLTWSDVTAAVDGEDVMEMITSQSTSPALRIGTSAVWRRTGANAEDRTGESSEAGSKLTSRIGQAAISCTA